MKETKPDPVPLFWPPKLRLNRLKAELFSPGRGVFSARWWGQGPKVDAFEREFGKRFGFKYPVMTNSGTSALWIAYVLAGVGPGKEVIVPVLTCTATCHPILWLGGKIVFADIRPDTLTLDPTDFEMKITDKTVAVVPVHLGGLVADAERIPTVALGYGIKIIGASCQALGARTAGYGDYTCFSFQSIKALTTGDGGMLCVKTREDYERAKKLRWFSIDRAKKARANWQAWSRRGITFEQEEPGLKAQPTDIDAAIGYASLESFDRNQAHREKIAKIYRSGLAGVPGIELLREGDSSNWLFTIKCRERDSLAQWLLKHGIETNVAHVRNDIFRVFGGLRQDLPSMDAVEFQYLCLPINTKVRLSDARRVVAAIKQWANERKSKGRW